jgi:hypothetical protein
VNPIQILIKQKVSVEAREPLKTQTLTDDNLSTAPACVQLNKSMHKVSVVFTTYFLERIFHAVNMTERSCETRGK